MRLTLSRLDRSRLLDPNLLPVCRIPQHAVDAGSLEAPVGARPQFGIDHGAAPDDSRPLSWQAVAVGDSCLFVVRGGRLYSSFPLEDTAQFDNSPALVCSNPANAGDLWEGVRRHMRGMRARGPVDPGFRRPDMLVPRQERRRAKVLGNPPRVCSPSRPTSP